MNLNSDHFPTTLHIPQNILIVRPPPLVNITPTRILNPIPPVNLEKFNIDFFETNSTQINELTSLLENHDHLTPDQWLEACIALDNILGKISVSIEKTCKATPIPTLTNRTEQHNKGAFYHENYPKNGRNTMTHTTLLEKLYTSQKKPQLANSPYLK